MFFCPDCNNSFDITRTVAQKGGADDEFSDTTASEDTGKNYELIQKIINNQPASVEDIEEISQQDLFKSSSFKKLKSKQRELVYNKIQDLLPKSKKKLIVEGEEKLIEENLAFFICNNCGLTKKIQPRTLIFSRASESISQTYVSGNYKDMIHSDILPRTRKYVCPNQKCESHHDAEKREAVFFRLNNSYQVKYICQACGTDF